MRKVTSAIMTSAMMTSLALADDHLVFGTEDDRFSWGDLEAFESLDLSGETISVFGPWLGVDETLVNSVFAYFEAATGATVRYAGSDSFEQQILIDVEAGSPPNVAIFPQPGWPPILRRAAGWCRWGMRWPTGRATTTPPVSPGSISAPTLTRTARRSISAFSTRSI